MPRPRPVPVQPRRRKQRVFAFARHNSPRPPRRSCGGCSIKRKFSKLRRICNVISQLLFTGLTGLDTSQTWMNVVGNNIANANTTAFKSSNVSFSSQFYVTDIASSAPNGNFGGTNPSQAGMGDQVSSISTNFLPGQIQTTGVDTNMAINGDGFFVVKTTSGQQYTRDGTFSLNAAHQLVTSGGAFVQGYGADTLGNVIAGST